MLNQETVNGPYVELIGRLDEGDYFSQRIAACQLYASIYEALNAEKQEVVRQKFAKLVKDDTPMVRWGAAQAMAVICHALDQEIIMQFLLPLLKELLQDKNDSVKVHAVQSSVVVCELINDAEVINQSIVPSLKQAFQNKQSWRLRFAVAENAAKIGQRLRREHVDQAILPFYVTLLGDSEPEVRSESVNKLADLAVNCSTNLIV